MRETDVEALRGAIAALRKGVEDYNNPYLLEAERAEVAVETTEAARDLLPLLDGLPDRLAALGQVADAARVVAANARTGRAETGGRATINLLELGGLREALHALDTAHDLRTPEQWLATPEFAHVEVIDPDGWREPGADWHRPISRGEFDERLARCTIMDNPHLPADAVERDAP